MTSVDQNTPKVKRTRFFFFFFYQTVQNNGVLCPTFEFIGLLHRHSLFSLLIVLSQPFPFLLGVDVNLCITLPHVLFEFRIHLIAVKQPVPLLSVSVDVSLVHPHPFSLFCRLYADQTPIHYCIRFSHRTGQDVIDDTRFY